MAATSTGGTVFRRAGAIDDASVPAVGTWADDECAVSTSGGEALFRIAFAKDIAGRVAEGSSIRSAAKDALKLLRELAPPARVRVHPEVIANRTAPPQVADDAGLRLIWF